MPLPLLARVNDERSFGTFCRHEPLLTTIVQGYQWGWTAEEKCQWLANLLRLRRPTTPQRLFCDYPDAEFALFQDGACVCGLYR